MSEFIDWQKVSLNEAAEQFKVAAINFQECLDRARRLEIELDKARQRSIDADRAFKKAEEMLLKVASQRDAIR